MVEVAVTNSNSKLFARGLVESIKGLFASLNFEVKEHSNQTIAEIKEALLRYSKMDHASYDAFVCCIHSHGRLGQAYARDGFTVYLLDLVEVSAANCSGLVGKPNMFFVDVCQTGERLSSRVL